MEEKRTAMLSNIALCMAGSYDYDSTFDNGWGNNILKDGWEDNNTSWYFNDSQNNIGKINEGEGEEYYLKSEEAVKTGWIKDDQCWYYLDECGDMVTGWNEIKGRKYYFKPDGSMNRGWMKDEEKWYYFRYSGSMTIGWKEINGSWYYFDTDGSMHTGWLNYRGTWYYLNADGSMAHDIIVDGRKISSNGVWVDENEE